MKERLYKLRKRAVIFLSDIFENRILVEKSDDDYSKANLFSFSNSDFYFFGKRPYWMDFNEIKLRNIFTKRMTGVEVIGRGVIINNKGFVELESTIFQMEYLNKAKCNHWIYFRKFLNYDIVENGIVLSNSLDRNYYHWILESVGRLVNVKNEDIKNSRIIVSHGAPQFVVDSLMYLLDISLDQIYFKKRIRLIVNSVVIPSFPITRNSQTYGTNIYHPQTLKRINLISKHRTSLEGDKRNFIISREKTKQRRIINTEVIQESFPNFDFQIVYLEDLSFMDQMQMFRNAGVIIATHGAGLTNLIFAENPLVIEFFPTNRNVRDAFYFYQISKSLGFVHSIIQYEATSLKQDLFIDISMLKLIHDIITKENNDYRSFD